MLFRRRVVSSGVLLGIVDLEAVSFLNNKKEIVSQDESYQGWLKVDITLRSATRRRNAVQLINPSNAIHDVIDTQVRTETTFRQFWRFISCTRTVYVD